MTQRIDTELSHGSYLNTDRTGNAEQQASGIRVRFLAAPVMQVDFAGADAQPGSPCGLLNVAGFGWRVADANEGGSGLLGVLGAAAAGRVGRLVTVETSEQFHPACSPCVRLWCSSGSLRPCGQGHAVETSPHAFAITFGDRFSAAETH